jgi:myosin heavy subunit
MAKALYGALFDWIVLQVNHVLVIKQQSPKEVIPQEFALSF